VQQGLVQMVQGQQQQVLGQPRQEPGRRQQEPLELLPHHRQNYTQSR
jgi:hypothetical protein